MTTLLLVRHGQSSNRRLRSKIWKQVDYDRERYDLEVARQIVPNSGLSELGHRQAKEFGSDLGPVFVVLGERALVVSSPMRRALETTLPLVRSGQIPRERFVCHAGLFEIGSRLYHREQRPSDIAKQLEADYTLTCHEVPSDDAYPAQPGGESGEQASARVDRACAWVESLLMQEAHELIVVVAHGHLLSRCLRRWMGVPHAQGLAFVHVNTGTTMLEWQPEQGLVVKYVNDHSHLVDAAVSGDTGDWWVHAGPLGRDEAGDAG